MPVDKGDNPPVMETGLLYEGQTEQRIQQVYVIVVAHEEHETDPYKKSCQQEIVELTQIDARIRVASDYPQPEEYGEVADDEGDD